MSYVLGIDTGGTYTDGVIIDRVQRNLIAKAKSLTTYEDLSIGISNVIHSLNFDRTEEIELVSLSTTLATNAIVEGRGCEVGLILIGFSDQKDLPSKEIRYIPGGHTIEGLEKEPFDEEAAKEALESLRGKVDALAISSYLSVRNPEHEIRTQQLAKEILGLNAVCGHQLTRSLGINERSVTAILNARLLSIIDDLIVSVKKSLALKHIDAPIMIVKGDGSLMGETQARERPIETILSGPAASIIGANFLAGEKNGMVLDMGGTTTDIAVLKNGNPKLNKEGARVGGWLTRVEAAAIDTFGLGGDSYIQKDSQGFFKLGPARVWPICQMSQTYPHLVDELLAIDLPRSWPLITAQVTDCYILLEPEVKQLSERDRQIVEIIREKPHSVFYIADALETKVNLLDFSHLVETRIVGRISVTPTDILHAKGLYNEWNTRGAKVAVSLLAKRFDMDPEPFVDFIMEKVSDRLAFVTWQSLLNQEGYKFDIENIPLFAALAEKQLEPQSDRLLINHLTPTIPVIGIGAPVRNWLPHFADKIDARLVIPEHTEVANAIGAAVGRVMEVVEILITPGENASGYNLYSSWERLSFEELEDAVEYGKKAAYEKAMQLAKENGAKDVEVILEHRDVTVYSPDLMMNIYLESHIEAIGTEKSDWI